MGIQEYNALREVKPWGRRYTRKAIEELLEQYILGAVGRVPLLTSVRTLGCGSERSHIS